MSLRGRRRLKETMCVLPYRLGGPGSVCLSIFAVLEGSSRGEGKGNLNHL